MFAFFVSKELEGDPANQMPVSDTFFRSIPYRRYGTHRRFICRTVGSATNEDCYLENSSVSRDGFFVAPSVENLRLDGRKEMSATWCEAQVNKVRVGLQTSGS